MALQFDPVAATNAYLAQLPLGLHEKARTYTQSGHWLILWGAISAVAAAWLVLRTGVLVRTREGIERKRPRPWLEVAAVVALDGVVELILGLPWDSYANWWREKAYGLTSQPFGGWIAERLVSAIIGLATTVVMFSLLYLLIRRARRHWWLWGGVVAGAGFLALNILQPVVIDPLFNAYTPAPPGAMRDAVVAMAKQVGVPSDRIYIYNGSKQSNRYTANVAGMFGTARVAMSDVMFKKDADLPEIRATVGHEMGHYVHNHIWWLSGVFTILATMALFLVDRLFTPVLRWTGAKGVRGLADPAGAPVIGIILAVLGLAATPVVNAATRIAEADADQFSLEHFNEPNGQARALVATSEYRYDSPGRVEEFLFYDHPSVRSRVMRCMDWKAAHPKARAEEPARR